MRTTPLVKYWAIALVGTILSFFLFFLVIDQKRQENDIIVQNAISRTELKIADELQKIHLVIKSMSFFLENTPHISQDAFSNFTNPFKKDLNGIKALEWAPNVLASEKDTFTASSSDAPITITKVANDSSELVVSEPKAIYYPIGLINPIKQYKGLLGFDLYSEATRKAAIKESISSGQMTLTGPVALVDNNDNIPGFLAIKAVYKKDSTSIKGVVAVVYQMDQFIANTLSTELNVLDLTIKDSLAENKFLFTTLSRNSELLNVVPENKLSMNAANRIWDIRISPKEKFAKFPHTLESYFVLLFGLLITLLVCLNIKGRDHRSAELEKKVGLRTQELEVSNRQKENLLREIHHRVMNNLQITSSLINLQKRKLKDKEAIYALTSSQDRINAIALIHQKIYQHEGVDAVDLKGYLENLIKSHKRMSPNVNYVIDCPVVFIDLDTAVPLALITSEIVVNALKHAFPEDDESNLLYILVTPMKDDVIDIVISDNGVGMPKDNAHKKESGLGHEIIKKLCRQLEAEHEYTSTESGTAFSLRFKQRKLQIPVFT